MGLPDKFGIKVIVKSGVSTHGYECFSSDYLDSYGISYQQRKVSPWKILRRPVDRRVPPLDRVKVSVLEILSTRLGKLRALVISISPGFITETPEKHS